MKGRRVFVRYRDGTILSKDEVDWRTVEAGQRAFVIGEFEARDEAERERLARSGEIGREHRAPATQTKHDAVRGDYQRFVTALASNERNKLLALLTEFKVEGKKRAQFSERNIASTLAHRHKLTATTVRSLVHPKRKIA